MSFVGKGTSDEHITVVENLQSLKPDGAVLVSTPQVCVHVCVYVCLCMCVWCACVCARVRVCGVHVCVHVCI